MIERFLKHKKISIVLVGIMLTGVLLYTLFFCETYASLTDKNIIKPPFGGHFGMTIEETCQTLGIKETDLIPAPKFETQYHGIELSHSKVFYQLSEDEMCLLDHYQNTYYVPYSQPIFGNGDHFIDGQQSYLRLIFTDETSYLNKTIPPLLCAVVFAYPENSDLNSIVENINTSLNKDNTMVVDRITGEAIPLDDIGTITTALNLTTTHKKAQLLSWMYTIGMEPEYISSLNVQKMSDTQINEWLIRIQNASIPAVRQIDISIQGGKNLNLEQLSDIDITSEFVIVDVGYYAYYDWFLNELT